MQDPNSYLLHIRILISPCTVGERQVRCLGWTKDFGRLPHNGRCERWNHLKDCVSLCDEKCHHTEVSDVNRPNVEMGMNTERADDSVDHREGNSAEMCRVKIQMHFWILLYHFVDSLCCMHAQQFRGSAGKHANAQLPSKSMVMIAVAAANIDYLCYMCYEVGNIPCA